MTRASGAVTAIALLLVLMFGPIAFGLAENWSAFLAFGAIFLIGVFWFPHAILSRTRPVLKGSAIVPLRLFVGLSALSVLYSQNKNLSLKHSIYLLAAYLVFYMLANVNGSRALVHGVLWCLVITATALSVYGLYMTFTGTAMVLHTAKVAYRESVTATYINKNHFAGFLEMTLFLTVGLVLLKGKKNSSRRFFLSA